MTFRTYKEIEGGGLSRPQVWMGVTWQSMAEARWARLLADLGTTVERGPRIILAEPIVQRDGYVRRWYQPDAWLPDLGWHVEVKPGRVTDEEATIIASAIEASGQPILLLDKDAPAQRCYTLVHGYHEVGMPMVDRVDPAQRSYVDVRDGRECGLACTFRYLWLPGFPAIHEPLAACKPDREPGKLSETYMLEAGRLRLLPYGIDVPDDEWFTDMARNFVRPFGGEA